MKILVLGGTYFVGRGIARRLVARGHDVTLLNRGTRTAELPTLFVDRNDPEAMRKALYAREFDVVIDTSCYDAMQAVIAEGALTRRYRHWLFLSSAAVYADSAPRPLTERSAAAGSDSFGIHGKRKVQAERVLAELCRDRLTILRSAYVYGPDNNLSRETFIWARLLCGEDIYMPGTGATRASFIHIDDLAQAVQRVVETPGQKARTYNVAHPDGVSFHEWLLCLARQANASPKLVSVPTREMGIDARQFFPFRDLDLTLDASCIREEAGFAPRFDLELGLAHTFESYERDALAKMIRSSSVELELDIALSESVETQAVSTSPRQILAS